MPHLPATMLVIQNEFVHGTYSIRLFTSRVLNQHATSFGFCDKYNKAFRWENDMNSILLAYADCKLNTEAI